MRVKVVSLVLKTSPSTFKCAECPYECSSKTGLVKHHRLIHSANTYKCKECSYSGPLRNSLIEHQKIHTREKMLKCLECSYVCTSKSTLVRHQRLHTGEKIYKYDLDYSRFSRKKERLLVLGEKPHKCDDCSASFGTKSRLFRHQISHSGVKPYKCGSCSYKCSRKDYLDKHRRSMHAATGP